MASVSKMVLIISRVEMHSIFFPQKSVPEEADEALKPKEAPVFVSLPEPVTVEEGEWARFCVRVTGHPRPRVMWLINGHTVVNVSNCAISRAASIIQT